MTYLWKYVNIHIVLDFVKRPVKLMSKKEEGLREKKIKYLPNVCL